MLYVEIGATQVGIFTRKGDEVHIVGWAMFGVVGGEGDDGGSARGIVVGSCIVDLFAQIAQMVVMGGENVATVVALASHLCNDVEALVVLQELIVDICFYALHAFDGLRCHPYDGLVYHLLAVGFEKFDQRSSLLPLGRADASIALLLLTQPFVDGRSPCDAYK